MASQKDFFREDSSAEENRKSALTRLSSTWDPKGKHEYVYLWIVLFNWDVDAENPFEVHELSDFNESDIRKEWISKNLGLKSRTNKLRNLSLFPGGIVSLFCKIEKGTSKKQRDRFVKDLNVKYRELACLPESDVAMCLKKMAENIPYRLE